MESQSVSPPHEEVERLADAIERDIRRLFGDDWRNGPSDPESPLSLIANMYGYLLGLWARNEQKQSRVDCVCATEGVTNCAVHKVAATLNAFIQHMQEETIPSILDAQHERQRLAQDRGPLRHDSISPAECTEQKQSVSPDIEKALSEGRALLEKMRRGLTIGGRTYRWDDHLTVKALVAALESCSRKQQRQSDALDRIWEIAGETPLDGPSYDPEGMLGTIADIASDFEQSGETAQPSEPPDIICPHCLKRVFDVSRSPAPAESGETAQPE